PRPVSCSPRARKTSSRRRWPTLRPTAASAPRTGAATARPRLPEAAMTTLTTWTRPTRTGTWRPCSRVVPHERPARPCEEDTDARVRARRGQSADRPDDRPGAGPAQDGGHRMRRAPPAGDDQHHPGEDHLPGLPGLG